jgi:hypothetical protein
METRMQNIAARRDILHAAETQSVKVKRDHATARLHHMATGLRGT